MSLFTHSQIFCCGSLGSGVSDSEINSEGDTETLRGHLETRKCYQPSGAEVPNAASSMWQAFLGAGRKKGDSRDG